jgi:O-antigen/teichoic acid export membrane protein
MQATADQHDSGHPGTASDELNLYGRQGARRSLLDTVAFRALSQICTLLSYVVMVRGMAERDFGVFNLLYGFVPVVSTVASLGLEQTLRRYQPEYLRGGNPSQAAWLVRVVSLARLATNIVVIGALLLTWRFVAPIFQLGPYRFEFALFAVLILLLFQSRILQLSLASHMLHRYSVGSLAVVPALKFVIYTVLWRAHAFSLQAAILADIGATGAAYLMLSAVHRRHCRPTGQVAARAPGSSDRIRMFRYGLYNNFNDVGAALLSSRSDNFFIAALINPVAVGAYSFYTRLNEMILNVGPGRLFDNVIQPVFFAIPPEQAKSRIPRYFTLMLNVGVPVQIAALAYCCAYHREIVIALFGGKFLDQSVLLPVVVAFGVLYLIATPVTLAAQYAEKASVILFSKVVVVYQIAMTLLLIPFAGLIGAAVATGTAQLLKNLVIWWSVRGTARWLNFRTVVLMSVLIWGGAALVCIAIRLVLPGPPLFELAIGVIVCALAGLIYVRSPAIGDSDREILSSVLHGRESRVLGWLGLLPRPDRA